jgi:hypothetical protein
MRQSSGEIGSSEELRKRRKADHVVRHFEMGTNPTQPCLASRIFNAKLLKSYPDNFREPVATQRVS